MLWEHTDVAGWVGDCSCTDVGVCGIPVATVSQDLKDVGAQGSWGERPNPRKLLRKAKLPMD